VNLFQPDAIGKFINRMLKNGRVVVKPPFFASLCFFILFFSQFWCIIHM